LAFLGFLGKKKNGGVFFFGRLMHGAYLVQSYGKNIQGKVEFAWEVVIYDGTKA